MVNAKPAKAGTGPGPTLDNTPFGRPPASAPQGMPSPCLLSPITLELPYPLDPLAATQASTPWVSTCAPQRAVRLENQALLMGGGRVLWRGPNAQAEAACRALMDLGQLTVQPAVHDLGGRLVTPGLVDCHTHMVFAGHRADEWERRLAGESYASIAAAGGGIRSTMRATRAASLESLASTTKTRLSHWLSQGVTTVEIKSGYGLSYDDELKLLRAISAAAADFPGTVMATFLGAHAIPPEFAANRDDYIHLLCTQLIPEIAATRLATAVDVFCETIAFSLDETSRILEAAQRHGLGIKLHAEQLSASGAAKRGAMMGALSCDHLEYLDGQGAEAMAASGTVAVLLPGSYYMLRETQKPPTDLLRQHKVPMAVATDFNPGTSPVASLLMAANFACILFGLTVSEAFYGITAAAAQAIGHKKPYGALLPGDSADLAIWESNSVAELISGLGQNLCVGVYARGHWCSTASLQGQTS